MGNVASGPMRGAGVASGVRDGDGGADMEMI